MTDFLKEIENAEKKASDIVEQAKQEALDIIKQAEQQAELLIQEAEYKAATNRKAMIKNAETDAYSRCNAEEALLDKKISNMKSVAEQNMDRAVAIVVKKARSV